MARLLGCPVAMPSHVGGVEFDSALMPGVPWKTYMLGETQIGDREGRILARLTYEDGEAYVAADVTLAEPRPPTHRDEVPPSAPAEGVPAVST